MKRPWALRCALGLLGAAMGTCAHAASAHSTYWGTAPDGRRVERTTLVNDLGMRLGYIDYGATLVEVAVPDRHGRTGNVLLSLPSLAAYEQTQRRFAAIVGRYAGRIAHARFPLDGRVVQLVPGKDGHTLHGGPDGYDKRVWTRHDFADATSLGSTFHLVSPDGDQHFPGRLEIAVTYRLLRQRNEFRIEYEVHADAPTVVNLTNHAFFNLAGAGHAGLDSHRFRIFAGRYAVTDAQRIPTGELAPVRGTPLDFRQPGGIAPDFRQPSPLLGDPPGYDHSLLLDHPPGRLALAAVIDETGSGRRLEVSTTEPAVVFFSGNGFDGSEVGSEGVAYRRHDGFALETQHLPDSPNHANFPTTRLGAGQTYRSETRYRFSLQARAAARPNATPGSLARDTAPVASRSLSDADANPARP